MKRYIKSDSEKIDNEYYAYALDSIMDNIDVYLEKKDDSYLDFWWVKEPIYYAYIANSGMTDITVAFISTDESKVKDLDMNSPEVQSILGGDEYRDEHNIEFDNALEDLYQKGIIVLDDEGGDLDYVGNALLLGTPLSLLIDQSIDYLGSDDIDEIYRDIIHDYGDKVVDNLYTDDKNRMIIPVREQRWRF